ncbi:MAG: hypothetical protein ACI30I_04660 [Parabacteroides sp.]
MTTDPNEIELADVAKEIGANVIIRVNDETIRLTNEQLQYFKSQGLPTTTSDCLMAGLILAGKSYEEIQAIMTNTDGPNQKIGVAFEAADGKCLNVTSPEQNPLLDQLMQAAAQAASKSEGNGGDAEGDTEKKPPFVAVYKIK